MHLAVEAVAINFGGGASLLADLLEAAELETTIDRVTVYVCPPQARDFNFDGLSKSIEIIRTSEHLSYLKRMIWYEKGFEQAASSIGADAAIFLTGQGKTKKCVSALIIHQSLPYDNQALRSLSLPMQMKMRLIKFLHGHYIVKNSLIVVPTKVMANYINNAFSAPIDRMMIAPTTPRNLPQASCSSVLFTMRNTDPNYRFLYVGGAQPYKNLKNICEALKLVRISKPKAKLFLTIPSNHPLKNQPGVVCVGSLKPSELNEAYHLATALIHASFVEAGALTLGEAMNSGLPVIVSDRKYAREICKESALFFEPTEPLTLAKQMLSLASDIKLRSKLSDAGKLRTDQARRDSPTSMMLRKLVELSTESQ